MCTVHSQLLWKITGKNQTKPSYIFATTPYISTTYIDSIAGIYPRFLDCDIVLGETLLNNIDSESKLFNSAILPKNITLKNYIAETDTAFVKKELYDKLKLNYKDVLALKPSVLINFYKDEIIKQALITGNEIDINSVFQGLAVEKGKPILGVTDFNELIKIISDTVKLKKHADKLVSLMRNNIKFQKEIIQLNTIYKTGNIDKFYQTAFNSEFTYRLPDNRYFATLETTNKQWLQKIQETLKSGNTFIVTDITRLYGEKGLIYLLKNEGYKVTAAIIE